ncbi:MAG: carbonic anhydrase [Thermomicrobiales bacterium]
MTVIDELVDANRHFETVFNYGHLPRRPSREVAVLTCIDARVDLYALLGLKPGEANLVRTAGGRAADAVRSLVVATTLLGIREIAVVHHTDCGLVAFTNEDIRAKLAADVGPEAAAAAEHVDFLPITDLDASVLEDITLLRTTPMIAEDIDIRGFVYHVESGHLREIIVEDQPVNPSMNPT